jgi:GT2 family glycosyltransferase
MIPVIGTAVVFDTYWVSRLLASVDFPVENFFIVNNNGKGEITEDLDNLAKIKHRYIKKIHVCHMPANMGVSFSWNLIIKSYMMAPYWVIVNDDVSFGPGLLAEMDLKVKSDPEVGMIHANGGDFSVGSWDLFLIRDTVVKQYGLFDENMYPAYSEDDDYIMRLVHKPIKKILGLQSNYYHGAGDKTQYHFYGGNTRRRDPEFQEKVDAARDLNIDYLTDKWGIYWRTCWPSFEPWEGKPHHLSEQRYDLEFIRSKYLGF